MAEIQTITELRKMQSQLVRGDQRELARRLGVFPTRVSDAFYGLVRDEEFLARLQAECEKLIKEREAVKS